MNSKEGNTKDVGNNISNSEWTKANTAFVIECGLEQLPAIRAYLMGLPHTRILFQKSSLGFLRIVEGKK